MFRFSCVLLGESTQVAILPLYIRLDGECDDSIESSYSLTMAVVKLLVSYGVCGTARDYSYGLCDPRRYSFTCSKQRNKRDVTTINMIVESSREPR